MTRKQTLTISAIVGVGLVLAAFILFVPDNAAPAGEDGEEADDYARGPNNGRLLDTENGRALEVTIFEDGLPPEMRVYPHENGEGADPREVDLTVELHRLGGVVDTIGFRPAGAYLRGDQTIYEPHSYDVVVRGTWGGQPFRHEFASIEGRVEIPAEVAEANGIEIEIAGPTEIETVLELPGEVQLNTDRVARVAPRLSGTVMRVPVGLGDRVGAGAVLAVIESRELGQAQAAYVESLHQMELAQAAYERERRLHERRISATREYEQARHDLEEAELEKQSAEQALRAFGVPPSQLAAFGVEPEGIAAEREVRAPLGASLTRYTLRAPMGGQVIERSLAVGQDVMGSEEAFVIADLSTVWVAVTVYANDLQTVRAGQAVVVTAQGDALGGPVGRGTIRYVGPLVGGATRSARAIVVLSNGDGRWRPGMFVTAVIVQETTEVPLAVRAEAVQTWREMDVVFTRVGDAYEVRPVTLGRRSGDLVEVLDGLAPGQEYVAVGSYLLKAELEKAGASHDH